MNPSDITALIRFKDSAETLPDVLSALQRQSLRPKQILAVDTGSTDHSVQILKQHGARVIKWQDCYHHSKALNFGLAACESDLVLCLSSHTVMKANDTLKRLAEQLDDPQVCACSIKWDDDPYYSDRIGWDELKTKGLKFGSIYSNSLGLLRHSLWRNVPFDENINGMEDYEWAIQQIRSGYYIARIQAQITYQRNAHNRDTRDTARTFFLADRYDLKVCWLGIYGSVKLIIRSLPFCLLGKPSAKESFATGRRRLTGALFWRAFDLNIN